MKSWWIQEGLDGWTIIRDSDCEIVAHVPERDTAERIIRAIAQAEKKS